MKEEAKKLIERFRPNVYCFSGSGMLSNAYDEDVVLSNAKKQAIICVEEVVKHLQDYGAISNELQNMDNLFRYYDKLIKEIEKENKVDLDEFF